MADIRTERLVLRPMAQADALALHAFFSDEEAMTYWSAPHTTLQETEDWVRTTVTSPPDVTREFSIWHGPSVIGKAGMWKRPELGYFLARKHWGKGFMHEALSALIPHLFKVMSLDVMQADVTPGNAASTRLLVTHGFNLVRVGKADHWDGRAWCDTEYYECPRSRHLPTTKAAAP